MIKLPKKTIIHNNKCIIAERLRNLIEFWFSRAEMSNHTSIPRWIISALLNNRDISISLEKTEEYINSCEKLKVAAWLSSNNNY